MKYRKTNLREYKQIIEQIPDTLSIKRELKSLHFELSKTIKDSKKEHSNKDYYTSRIDTLYGALRRAL